MTSYKNIEEIKTSEIFKYFPVKKLINVKLTKKDKTKVSCKLNANGEQLSKTVTVYSNKCSAHIGNKMENDLFRQWGISIDEKAKSTLILQMENAILSTALKAVNSFGIENYKHRISDTFKALLQSKEHKTCDEIIEAINDLLSKLTGHSNKAKFYAIVNPQILSIIDARIIRPKNYENSSSSGTTSLFEAGRLGNITIFVDSNRAYFDTYITVGYVESNKQGIYLILSDTISFDEEKCEQIVDDLSFTTKSIFYKDKIVSLFDTDPDAIDKPITSLTSEPLFKLSQYE